MWVLLLCKVKTIFKQRVDRLAVFLLIRDHNPGVEGWEVSLKVDLSGQRWAYSSPGSMGNTHCLNQSCISSGKKDFRAESGTSVNIRAETEKREYCPFQFVARAAPGWIPQRKGPLGTGNVLFLACSWLSRDRKESCDGKREELPVAGVC